MSGSLKDQLLKSGLVDRAKAAKAGKDKHRQRKRGAATNESAQAVREERARKVERDRALERERKAAQEARELDAQIRQLVERHRVPLDGADEPYNYTEGSVVRKLWVTGAVRRGLASGSLGVVALGEAREVVPRAVVERIAERDPARVVLLNDPAAEPDADDDYAGYEIPDDLMW